MYISIYISISIYIYIYISIYIYMCVGVWVCVCVCIYTPDHSLYELHIIHVLLFSPEPIFRVKIQEGDASVVSSASHQIQAVVCLP